MTRLFRLVLALILGLINISCDSSPPVAAQYKADRLAAESSGDAQPANDAADAEAGATDDDEVEEDPDADEEEEEEEEAEPDPAAVEAMLVADGKLTFDTYCVGCHGPAAMPGPIQSRDPAFIQTRNNSNPNHTNLGNNFPTDPTKAENLVKFLEAPAT